MRQKSGGIQKTDERKEDNRMGFFDKKQCGICGKDAGRLLAYTLKDNKHLCDECFHKIYTGFNSLNAQFSLEHYRDHYLPYYEKTKKNAGNIQNHVLLRRVVHRCGTQAFQH